ncbi:chloride channel protein [Hwanghaeella sp.]|uniref:chloride channel protein n=1 Tax=Hwanghaeella sp. TaxID=2605943 RepID=UPI003CCC14B0
MSALAVLVGLIGGGAAIVFREAIAFFQLLFYGFSSELVHSHVAELPWWHILAATTGGGLAVGLIIYWFLPNRQNQAVADVIEAEALKGGDLPVKPGLTAALVSAITIGSGGSAGREGPVVHFAACLSAFFSNILHLDKSQRQTLLGCGVAAGVAASFNAPIAGVFFALEVVMGNYALAAFAPVVIASVTGTIVCRIYFGHFPAFIIPSHEIVSFWEFPAFALLGLVSAVAAISFTWSIGVVRRVGAASKIPQWALPAIGGLGVGVIGIFFPQVLGVGYEATDEALNQVLSLQMLILLAVLKTAATAITLGSGAGGGVFSPSLFIGAMVGGAFGVIATVVFPHLSSGHGAYTLVGMGAVSGAVLGAPMSTILMVFELTGDYELTIGVMIATVISSQVTQLTFGYSYFTWQLAQRGVNLLGGREALVMRSYRVANIMRKDHHAILDTASLSEVRKKLGAVPYGELFVIDKEGGLVGTVMLRDLKEFAFDSSKDASMTVEDVVRRRAPFVKVGEDLGRAMDLLEKCGEEHVAVVQDAGSKKLLGVLHERDVLSAYHRAVQETRT